jgi:hypothetical protein
MLSIAVFEVFEVTPTGTSRVNYSCHANPESEAIWWNAIITGIGVAFARSRINMNMDVNKSGSNIESLNVDSLQGIGGRNVSTDLCNSAVFNCYIHDGIDVVLVVKHVTVTQK